MKTVRRLKCKKDMNDMLVVGDIYTEYALTPNYFYPSGRNDLIEQVGLDVRTFEEKGLLDKYFDEVEPIEWAQTREYPQVFNITKTRIKYLEYIIKENEEELNYLKELIE